MSAVADELAARLRALRTPVFLAYGDSDTSISVDAVSRFAVTVGGGSADCACVVYAGGRHGLILDGRQEVGPKLRRDMGAWLSRRLVALA